MMFYKYLKKILLKWVLFILFVVIVVYLSYFLVVSLVFVLEEGGVFLFFWVLFVGWFFYFCLVYYCGKEYKCFLVLLN